MKKALVNVRIYDYQNYIENGFIIYEERILAVGPMTEFVEGDYVKIEGHGNLVIPNFVCAHSHIYSTFARGLSLPFNPKNFQEILDQMWWKIDSKIDNQITYFSGIAASSEFVKNGITTVIDHHASGQDIIGSLSSLKKAIVDDCGLRAALCFETSDRFNVDDCILENKNFYDNNRNYMVRGLFGMHASMSLSDETLSKIKENLGDAPIHCHVAESEMDEQDSLTKYNKTIIQRFDEHELINPNSLIVHGVYISDEELDIIAKRKAYMVVNTTSNMNNAVGIPDVKKFMDKGIKVMVGNDGLSNTMATEYLNLYYTQHLKNNSPTGFSLNDVITCINNSYEYVSNLFNIKLGRLQPGYEADFMMHFYKPLTPMNKDNAFGHIFFGLFPAFRPINVVVGGQTIIKNGTLLNSKIEREIAKTEPLIKEFYSRIKEEA